MTRLHSILLLAGFVGTLLLGHWLTPTLEAEEEPMTPGAIAVMGDSLSRANGLTLAQVLDFIGSDDCGATYIDRCTAGMHLGDHFSRASEAVASGARGVLIELNVYIFNERIHLGTPRPRHVVTRDHDHVAALYSVASPRLWYSLFRQAGVDTVWSTYLAGVTPLIPRGAKARSKAREVLAGAMWDRFSDEHFDRDVNQIKRAEDRVRVFGTNFREKQLDGGVDDLVFEELLDWMNSHPDVGFAFFVPPLNRERFEELAPGSWDRFQEWIASMAQRAEERGVPLFDYSLFFDETPDVFKDYGHVKSIESMRDWAAQLLAEITALGWCP